MKYNLNNTHTIGLQMNVHFCERCDNLTGIYIKEEDNTLIHHCSSCNLSYPFEPEERCIYKIEFGEKDKSLALNENKYITQDVTLPKLVGNPNIVCMNAKCPTITENKESSVTYIKYDEKDLRFLYISDYCGQKWQNK